MRLWLLALLLSPLSLQGQQELDHGPSVYSAIAEALPDNEMTIFPFAGRPVVRSLPPLAAESASLNGRVMYGILEVKGIQRFDLVSGRMSTLSGTEAFSAMAFNVAPQEDSVALVYLTNNTIPEICQLAVVSLPSGRERLVGEKSPCYMGWRSMSVSPDRKKLLMEEGTGMKLMDLETGSSKQLKAYVHAAFSPDGKWVAALSGRGLELLDASSFRHIRSLGRAFDEHPTWSPDSRYLLVGRPFCSAYSYTLSAVDVYTGKQAEIKSSHCSATHQGHWWVGAEVYRALAAPKAGN